MSEAERLNALLSETLPAAARCLSEVGRRVAFPRGIPAQSGEARGTEINATIGQITDGDDGALPLPALQSRIPALDPSIAFLYSPQDGQPALRLAWQARQRAKSGGSEVPTSLPVVTHGLSQGISMVADLFADADTTVVLPSPSWENYKLLFAMRARARFREYPAYDGDGVNVQGLADALAQVEGKAIIVLTFPGNPTGLAPTVEEARRIAEVVLAHPGPAVALVDDAYAGLLYEDGLMERSLFWDLAERADPERLLVARVDGGTKELLFFPGRVGFLTFSATGDAEAALISKVKCLGRGTCGSPPGPSQAVMLDALQDPDLEHQIDARVALLGRRYRTLKDALVAAGTDRFAPLPFNSGCFALVELAEGIAPHAVRRRLIDEFSVGTIAVPDANALRIAFCATAEEDIPALVQRLERAVS